MNKREKIIWDKLVEHYDEARSLGYEIVCVVLQGSQNYNLDIYSNGYQSDVDTKAIILPSFEDFCKGFQPVSTTHVRENNEHIDIKDIRIILETFRKQNINFVEVLFSKYFIVSSKYFDFWRKLQSLGEAVTHCHPSQTIKAMAGMSLEKRKALCHPYPTIKDKIEKYGYDGKQLHHIIRINEFIKHYIGGMSFRECLEHHEPAALNMMINAKLNLYSLDEALSIADRLNAETDSIKNSFIEKNGTSCDNVPYKELEQIKVDVLKQWFKEQLL